MRLICAISYPDCAAAARRIAIHRKTICGPLALSLSFGAEEGVGPLPTSITGGSGGVAGPALQDIGSTVVSRIGVVRSRKIEVAAPKRVATTTVLTDIIVHRFG